MYRKKIMAIFVLAIVGLLGTMLWSSNVVVEDQENKKNAAIEDTNMEDGDFAKEHKDDEFLSEKSEEVSEKEVTQPETKVSENESENENKSGYTKEYTQTYYGIYINQDILQPVMPEYYSRIRLVDSNYLDKLGDKKLVLWNVNTFPLKVYIKRTPKVEDDVFNMVNSAFNIWQNFSKNIVKFEIVSSPDNANIFVNIIDTPVEDCSSECALNNALVVKNNVLTKAELKISKYNCDGTPMSNSMFNVKLMHSIGHILGLDFHSDTSFDIMNKFIGIESNNISSNDIETLRLLYKFKPEITNKPYNSTQAKNLLNPSIIRGKNSDEIYDILNDALKKNASKEKTVEDYIKSARDKYTQGAYSEAIKEFNFALNYADKSWDKQYIHNALAIINIEDNRNMDAYSEALKAAEYGENALNTYILAYMKYISGHEMEALDYLNKLLEDSARYKPAYALAAEIYYNNARILELEDLANKARSYFYDDLPVVFDKETYEKARAEAAAKK